MLSRLLQEVQGLLHRQQWQTCEGGEGNPLLEYSLIHVKSTIGLEVSTYIKTLATVFMSVVGHKQSDHRKEESKEPDPNKAGTSISIWEKVCQFEPAGSKWSV